MVGKLAKPTSPASARAHAIVTLFLLFFDIYSTSAGMAAFSAPRIILAMLLAGSLALSAKSPRFELVFISIFLLGQLLSLRGERMLDLAIYLAIAIWVMRAWVVAAIFVLFAVETTIFLQTPDSEPQTSSSLLLGVTVLVLSLALKWQKQRRIYAENTARKAQKTSAAKSRALAQELHDNTAKDLAHIILLARDFAIRHPEFAEASQVQIDIARNASRRIRALIATMNIPDQTEPMATVIEQIQGMLLTRHITLRISMPNLDESLLSSGQLATGNFMLRECASNVLKYSPENSQARLVIGFNEPSRELTILMSNDICSEGSTPDIGGGFGLANLKVRVESQGGEFAVGTTPTNQWFTHVTIPGDK
ncbi:sensor histidine kinase [Actinobaculum suis]|uniref:sensor histidine kinase n=1 Tax=Actinobaculum suis TaxID=1657 RepID=UPI00066FEAD4|nr:ATP-binding protein [Actinobaculum suis]